MHAKPTRPRLTRRIKNSFGILLCIGLLNACQKDPIDTHVPPNVKFSGEIGALDNSTILVNDGNLILCGTANGAQFIEKVSPTGMEIWRKEYDLGSSPFAPAIVESSTGELYMSASDSRLVKLTATGDTLWTNSYGGDFDIRDLAVATDGSILIATSTWIQPCTSQLINVDATGDIVWNKLVSANSINHLTTCSNGEIVAVGFNGDGLYGQNLVISRFTSNGTLLWTVQPEGLPATTIMQAVAETPSGNLMMCGYSQNGGQMDNQGGLNPVSSGPSYFYLYSIDPNGITLFSKQIGFGKASSIQRDVDGKYTIIGYLGTENIISKFDQDGNISWFKPMGVLSTATLSNLQTNSMNENFITGNIGSSVFLMRTNSAGEFE